MSALLEPVSTFFAAAYVLLAIRQSLWCWPAALISVVLMLIVVLDAKLYANALLQGYYFAMGVYGWYAWSRGGEEHEGVRVHWWPWRIHAVVIAGILAATLAAGWLFGRTDAANPYLDSFSTIAAVVTTFMVARKLIENWIYWLVIDSVLIWVYLQNGLGWYVALSVFYIVMAAIGLRAWIVDWQRHERDAPDDGSTRA